MAKTNIFASSSIFDSFQQMKNKKLGRDENYNWFKNVINQNVHSENYEQLRQQIITDPTRISNRFFLGKLYFFFYNQPEDRMTLPFYDTFPLLLLLRRTKNNMFGINLHYLPPKRRLSTFLQLLKYTTDNRLTKGTRIILPYGAMVRDKKWKILKSCFRQYKISKIQGNLINISAPDWPIAVNLPVERFKKQGKKFIWDHTLREEML